MYENTTSQYKNNFAILTRRRERVLTTIPENAGPTDWKYDTCARLFEGLYEKCFRLNCCNQMPHTPQCPVIFFSKTLYFLNDTNFSLVSKKKPIFNQKHNKIFFMNEIQLFVQTHGLFTLKAPIFLINPVKYYATFLLVTFNIFYTIKMNWEGI